MNLWEKRRDESSKKKKSDQRSEWDRDLARVLHSASFRSLQGKPQILNLGDSDYYRTRLTHSLEVVQLSTSILRQLGDREKFPDDLPLPALTLLQTICFAHDLGHPPFGHGGEVALNFCMRDHGGFEGNGQTLRILSRLAEISPGYGANLTRRAMLGVLKYPIKYSDAKSKELRPQLLKSKLQDENSVLRLVDREESKPPKCYLDSEKDVVDWLLEDVDASDRERFFEKAASEGRKHAKTKHKSFDCSIMDVCDDLAYGVHDLEDAIYLGLITSRQFEDFSVEDNGGNKQFDSQMREFFDWIKSHYPEEFKNDVPGGFLKKLFDPRERKGQISRIIGYLAENIEVKKLNFKEPLLKYRVGFKPEAKKLIDFLQAIVREKVILSPSVQHLEFKGQRAVISVFEVFASEPKMFLPPSIYETFKNEKESYRVICDYIAGMTDATVLKVYDRLFSPRMGSVFDKL